MKYVLLPVFNEATTLVSVVEKLLPNCDHLIIINDGSTDGSRTILSDIKSRTDPSKVTFLHNSDNQGMSQALRIGMNQLLALPSLQSHLKPFRFYSSMRMDSSMWRILNLRSLFLTKTIWICWSSIICHDGNVKSVLHKGA